MVDDLSFCGVDVAAYPLHEGPYDESDESGEPNDRRVNRSIMKYPPITYPIGTWNPNIFMSSWLTELLNFWIVE